MITSPVAHIFSSLILFLVCSLLPVYAEVAPVCDIDELFQELSSEPVGYEKIEKTLLEASSEGAHVEYYYSTDALKKIKTVFYGSIGKTEIQYHFATPDTYAAKVINYYYSAPIHTEDSDFFPDFQIVSTNKSEFAVCRGELVRGILDNLVVEDFEQARRVLGTILPEAPRKNMPGRENQ